MQQFGHRSRLVSQPGKRMPLPHTISPSFDFSLRQLFRSTSVSSSDKPFTSASSYRSRTWNKRSNSGLHVICRTNERSNSLRQRKQDSSTVLYEESETDHSSSSLSNVEEEIQQQLADVTFEELHKAHSNGSHLFFQKPKEDKKLKRANKNRPMEASCKKPVPIFREVVQAPKKVVRDPRFESLCGKLDPEGFRKRYNFLYENNLPTEREALQTELKKCKDPKIINDVKERISWINKQLKSDSAKHIDTEILANHKKKEREAAKQGKHPFYLNKSEIRKQRLIEKYKDLKSSGKLDAYMEKKRKRNAAKDLRYVPYRRSGDSVQ